jgi:hypothetical protein
MEQFALEIGCPKGVSTLYATFPQYRTSVSSFCMEKCHESGAVNTHQAGYDPNYIEKVSEYTHCEIILARPLSIRKC